MEVNLKSPKHDHIEQVPDTPDKNDRMVMLKSLRYEDT